MPSDAVVLLHGQPGSARDWVRVLPLLGDRDVVARDRPGYDGSPAGGFWHNADAIDRLLDDGGHDRAVLVGHSWGAGAALAYAVRRPERVSGLVLVAPVGTRRSVLLADRLVARPLPGALFAGVSARIGSHGVPLVVRATRSRLPAVEVRRLKREAAQRDMRADWRAWQVEQRALVSELPGLEARLAEVRAPAVVLAASRDLMVPPRAVRELADRLPDARYVEVQAGHYLPLESPQAVADAVAAVTDSPSSR